MARRLADCRRTTPPGSGRTWQMSSKSAQAVKDLENRFFIQRKVYQALVRSRLYSSGALVIGVDQGNPEEELDLDKVGQGDLKSPDARDQGSRPPRHWCMGGWG